MLVVKGTMLMATTIERHGRRNLNGGGRTNVASLEWERECGGDVSLEWIEKNERQCNAMNGGFVGMQQHSGASRMQSIIATRMQGKKKQGTQLEPNICPVTKLVQILYTSIKMGEKFIYYHTGQNCYRVQLSIKEVVF